MSVSDARAELARRYVHIFGPTTAGVLLRVGGHLGPRRDGHVRGNREELVPARSPIGEGWLLARDEPFIRDGGDKATAPARLLPSGDTFFLLWGRDRELLVPDARRRPELWTPRVWPGALLVKGEIAGVWRRANEKVTIDTWRELTSAEKEAIESEARSMPLPGLERQISVSFAQAA